MTSRLPDSTRLSTLERQWRWGGVLLGLGLGGFFDGIVFHQILQWHDLLSSVYPPEQMGNMRLNMRADGWFHAATWLLTLSGVALLWRGTHEAHPGWPTRPLVGCFLVGWGAFNLVEGLLDHHLLGLHHVRPGPHQLAYDLGFLLWGAVMLLVGLALQRQRKAL